ncbi:MAG: HAD family phosphatase, partial [Jatrophihabitans sp.]
AVLFDMDGTIVDTEPYWIEAEYALVAAHGGAWSDAHAHALVGNALLASAQYLRAHGGVELEPEVIVERLMDDVLAATRRQIPWRDGAVELIRALGRRDIPCALVTMSYARLAEAVVQSLHAGAFTTVVTGDEVVRGKPDPEAYLTAARRLGVDPRHCVAIEDSPTGIAAAAAAGCVVVAVPHHVPVPPDSNRLTVASLADLDVGRLESLVEASR